MKTIKDRKEIAAALNFGQHPVIMVNCIAKDNGYCRTIEGGAVKVITERGAERCELVFFDRKSIKDDCPCINIGAHGTFLTERFTVADIVEMATYANAPTIKAGDTVAFVLIGADKTRGAVVLADVVSTRADCSTSAYLEEGASEHIAKLAWKLAE